MNIRTYSERTPWGIEWYAIGDDTYNGAPDGTHLAGVGPTESAAIADLAIGLEEHYGRLLTHYEKLVLWYADPANAERAAEIRTTYVAAMQRDRNLD